MATMGLESIRIALALLVICFTSCAHSFMDMEELKSVYYGLDILSEPVMLNEDTSMGTVQVTSKYGQQYQCCFPDHTEAEKKKEEEEKVAVETGIVEILKPMQSEDCLIKVKDWWTYEFCYGKSVRQYHMEEGAIKGAVINLGTYESDFDWSNETAKGDRLKTVLASYHSQQYTQGDNCDLTGKPRRVEAKFMCEENSEDYLARIEESETCVYTMTIMTSRICRHPYLRPPMRRKEVAITCNPVLTKNEFMEYQTSVNEQKMAAEKYKESKAKMHTMDKDLENALAETAKNLLSEPSGSLFPTPDENGLVTRESFSKMFGSSDRLWELYQKGLELKKQSAEERRKKLKEIKEYQKKDGSRDTNKEQEDDDDEILNEFSEEIDSIKKKLKKTKNKFTHIKEKLGNEKSWENSIEHAIKEAEAELGMKLDRTLVAGLSNTLNKLVNDLQDTEAELDTMDDKIKGLKSDDKEGEGKAGETKDASDKTNNGDSLEGSPDKDAAGDDDEESKKKKKGDVLLKGEGFDQNSMDPVQSKKPFDNGGRSSRPGPLDNKIKSPPRTDQQNIADQKLEVPSTFPLPKEPAKEDSAPESGDEGDGSLKDASGVKTQDGTKIKIEMDDAEDLEKMLPDNIKEMLEDTVRKEYEKKRVRGGSGKLGLDDDHSFIQDKSIHVIQQDDKEGNTNRFIFVLGFKNLDDESSEQDKQATLEENYGFVFKKNAGGGGGGDNVIAGGNEDEAGTPDR